MIEYVAYSPISYMKTTTRSTQRPSIVALPCQRSLVSLRYSNPPNDISGRLTGIFSYTSAILTVYAFGPTSDYREHDILSGAGSNVYIVQYTTKSAADCLPVDCGTGRPSSSTGPAVAISGSEARTSRSRRALKERGRRTRRRHPVRWSPRVCREDIGGVGAVVGDRGKLVWRTGSVCHDLGRPKNRRVQVF